MHPLDEYIASEDDLSDTVVKVEVLNQEKEKAADFGEGTTYTLAGTTSDVPVQVLPQTKSRDRAVITASNPAGLGTIIIGSLTKVSNGQGYTMHLTTSGVSLVIKAQSAVYVMSDKTNAASVSVWDERYQ